jgi:hypothetical protein
MRRACADPSSVGRHEGKIALLPDLHFLHSSQVAQQVMAALRKAQAKPPEPHVGLTVPPGDPGRLRRPT